MDRLLGYLVLATVLVAPLYGQGRELGRSPSPKEIIAQLLLRRAQKISAAPVATRTTPVFRPPDDPPGGGGGGGDGGLGGGGNGLALGIGEGGKGREDQLIEEEVEELASLLQACTGPGCGGAGTNSFKERWTMPLIQLGDKQYYLGIFFKANWYRAAQYCRFHGMQLAGVEKERQNRFLEQHIQEAGLGHEHFWTSGTDQGDEGRFFWMSNGQPVTFTNWNAGEPNNFQYENGEMEHCLELWNRDGKGLKWNDSPCSFETFFICEV